MSKTKYTAADLAAVSDNPEWTADDFAKAVPFDRAFPDLAATIRSRGSQKAPTKISTTIRLSRDVIDHFRTTGNGWQSRIDKALKEWIATH
ncbi:MAG: BrnA antitoxin family protein [Sphingorhabdus sp.]